MPERCPECNGRSVWDDAVGSAVCTSCGTLTDPSQSVLTSIYDFHGDYNNNKWQTSHTTIPKHFRASSNWLPADQGKEAREQRNSIAIAEFIKSLSLSLNAAGLSPRAITLFNQAKAAMSFHWGRKAKVAAGACLAVALRESNRPDCLQDIAYLMVEPTSSLSRAFHSIVKALALDLTSIGSAAYIPVLHSHLSSLLQDHASELPSALTLDLNRIPLQTVIKTAESLSHVIARVGPVPLVKYSAPSIACAIYILSFESELRGVMKQPGSLAQALGVRLHVNKPTIMACYRTAQDVLANLAESVPWLDKYESKKGRAKLGKGNVVARAIKDIITFYEDSWRTAVKPVLTIDNEEGQHEENTKASGEENDGEHVYKKRKIMRPIKDAVRFLLDPATAPIPSTSNISLPSQQLKTHSNIHSPLVSYLLSAQASPHNPTRLQLLSVLRGGPEEVSDEELFEEGELEDLLRSEKEMDVLRQLLEFDQEDHRPEQWENEEESSLSSLKQEARQKSNRDGPPPQGGKPSRINLEALAKFMNDEASDVEAVSDKSSEDYRRGGGKDHPTQVPHEDEVGMHLEKAFHTPPVLHLSDTADEVIITDWRPISPVNTRFDYNSNRYEEDYYEF